MTKTVGRQPWLQDAQISVFGNATALCDPDGRMGAPATGLLIDDRLVLGGLSLALNDEAITVIAKSSTGAVTSLWGCARNVGDHGPDPTVEVPCAARWLLVGCEKACGSSRAPPTPSRPP